MKGRIRAALLSLALAGAMPAWAGAGCSEQPLTAEQLAQASRMGVKLFQRLQQSDAQAVVLGRIGSDLSKYGLRFSHVGLALREHPKGAWSVLHLLNSCGTEQSDLFDEGLINFFLDNPFEYEAVVLVPDGEVQARLKAAATTELARQVHEPRYNLIAYPWSEEFQNSNQWLLEFMAGALAEAPVANRLQARKTPFFAAYTPDTIAIDRLTRLGGGLFKANMSFNDHPFGARVKGDYQVVTVRSIGRLLAASGHLSKLERIKPGPAAIEAVSGPALSSAVQSL